MWNRALNRTLVARTRMDNPTLSYWLWASYADLAITLKIILAVILAFSHWIMVVFAPSTVIAALVGYITTSSRAKKLWKVNIPKAGVCYRLKIKAESLNDLVNRITAELRSCKEVLYHRQLRLQQYAVISFLVKGGHASLGLSKAYVFIKDNTDGSYAISVRAFKRFLAPYDNADKPKIDEKTYRCCEKIKNAIIGHDNAQPSDYEMLYASGNRDLRPFSKVMIDSQKEAQSLFLRHTLGPIRGIETWTFFLSLIAILVLTLFLGWIAGHLKPG
jgi:hypothetical protein